MDERTLFDRFHEALETEPRPGAYERLRFAMTNPPVVLKRRPAFRMRFSKMTVRIAAAVAAAALALAIVAAFLATHHAPPTGSVNAGQDQNFKAYQAMVRRDYVTMSSSESNHCSTIQDTGCAAAVVPVDRALQQWINDLEAFPTPPRYAVLDGQLRRHLSQAITDLNSMVAFQRTNNLDGFNLAMHAALSERAWIDPTFLTIEGTYFLTAASYHDAIEQAKRALDACVSGTGDLVGCGMLATRSASVRVDCRKVPASDCESNVQFAATQLQTFLILLVQNPAPSSLAAADAQLQSDLAQADTALLTITDGLLSADSSKVAAGQNSYAQAINAADTDLIPLANA